MTTTLRQILVVDDAADCVETLDVALGPGVGMQVSSAGTAEQALDILNSKTVAGVITDIQLPFMSGLELIAWIREQPRFRRLPILVISADPDPASSQTALRLGADGFFAKPFSPAAVRRRLEELIHESSTA